MMITSKQQALSCRASTSRTAPLAAVRRFGGFKREPLPVVKAQEGQEGPEGAPSLLEPGTKVKVSASIKVYHVPKQPQGVELQGMMGKIEKNVALYTDRQGKSHVLSPNFPYVVKLDSQIDGKDITIKAHLEEDELEVIQ